MFYLPLMQKHANAMMAVKPQSMIVVGRINYLVLTQEPPLALVQPIVEDAGLLIHLIPLSGDKYLACGVTVSGQLNAALFLLGQAVVAEAFGLSLPLQQPTSTGYTYRPCPIGYKEQ